MYHILSIHSSLDGHLDCFCVLAIINSAAMNIEAHVYMYPFRPCFSLDICPGKDQKYRMKGAKEKSKTSVHLSCFVLTFKRM